MITRNRAFLQVWTKSPFRYAIFIQERSIRSNNFTTEESQLPRGSASIRRSFVNLKNPSSASKSTNLEKIASLSLQDHCKGLPTSQLIKMMFRITQIDWHASDNPSCELYLMDLKDIMVRIKQELKKYDMSDMRALILESDLVRLKPVIEGVLESTENHATLSTDQLLSELETAFFKTLEDLLQQNSLKAINLLEIASGLKELVFSPKLDEIALQQFTQHPQYSTERHKAVGQLLSLLLQGLQQPSAVLLGRSTLKQALARGLKLLRSYKTDPPPANIAWGLLLRVLQADPQTAAIMLPLDTVDAATTAVRRAIQDLATKPEWSAGDWQAQHQCVTEHLAPLLGLLSESKLTSVTQQVTEYTELLLDRLDGLRSTQQLPEEAATVWEALLGLGPVLQAVCGVHCVKRLASQKDEEFGPWTTCSGELAARERIRILADLYDAGSTLKANQKNTLLRDLQYLVGFLRRSEPHEFAPQVSTKLRTWAGLNWCEVSAFMNSLRLFTYGKNQIRDQEIADHIKSLMTLVHRIFVRRFPSPYSPEIYRYTYNHTRIEDSEAIQLILQQLNQIGKLRASVQFELGYLEGGVIVPDSRTKEMTSFDTSTLIVVNGSTVSLFATNLYLKELSRILMYLDKYSSPLISDIFSSKSRFKELYVQVMKITTEILEAQSTSYSWVFRNHDCFLNYCQFVFASAKVCTKAGVFGGNQLLELGLSMLKTENPYPHLQLRLMQFILACFSRKNTIDTDNLDKTISDLFDRSGGMKVEMIEPWINLIQRYKVLPRTELAFEQLILNKLEPADYCAVYSRNVQIRNIYSAIFLCETRRPAQRAIQKLIAITTSDLRKSLSPDQERQRQATQGRKSRLVEDYSAASEKLLGILNYSESLLIDPKIRQEFKLLIQDYLEQNYGKKTEQNHRVQPEPVSKRSMFAQSNLQKKVAESLTDLGYTFEEEVLIQGYRVDFLLPENMILEAIGAVHFNSSGGLVDQEKFKQQSLLKSGYKVRYITQDVMGGGRELRKALLKDVIDGKLDTIRNRELWQAKKLKPLRTEEVGQITAKLMTEPLDPLEPEFEYPVETVRPASPEDTAPTANKASVGPRTFSFSGRPSRTNR